MSKDLPFQPARLATPEQAREFLFGGNATLTLKSIRTGTHFTYKVRVSDDERAYFVSLMTGPDNEDSFQYLGYFRDGYYSHGVKSKVGKDAPGAKAFDWFTRQLDEEAFPETLEVWHEGRCCKCNRKLTHPDSIASGIGPECGKVRLARG